MLFPFFPCQPTSTRRCELMHAAGIAETCPGRACLYWEDGRGCVLGGLRPELATNPQLVSLLAGLREQLGARRLEHVSGIPGLDP